MAYYFSYSAKALSSKLKEITTPELYSKLYNKNKLHCTMLYSHDDFQEEYRSLKLPDIDVTIESIDVWTTEKGSVVVARLNSPAVYSMHQKIVDTFNKTLDREFNPHITLKRMLTKEEFLNTQEISQLEALKGYSVKLKKFDVIPVVPKPKLKI